MKKIITTIVTISILFATLCSNVSAEHEKTVLRIYNWGEYISNGSDDTLDVIAEFEKRFPEIDVEYTTYGNNEEMYAKIVSGSAKYDIIIPSDYMISKMINENMLAKLDYDNIPNFQKVDKEFNNLEYDPKNEYSVPYTWGTVGIIYNKTMVTEPVISWDILWNDEYINNVLMFDNPRDSYGIALKKLGFSQNSSNTDELDKATQILKEQKKVVQAYVMDEIFAKMSNNEAALAPYYAGDAITMIKDNPNLDFAIPKEGTNKFVDAMVVLKSSKNKSIAEKYINFMLEPDIAKANTEFIGYSTPMSNVKELLDGELKNSQISYPSSEILSKCETFINLPDATNTYMQEGWVDVKAYGENGIIPIILLCITIVSIGVLFILLMRKRKKNR